MSNIKEEILSVITVPRVSLKSLTEKHGYFKNTLKEYLNCKEVRTLSSEEQSIILGWSPTILFPEYEKFYNEMAEDDLPENDYSDLKDGYGVSEIFVVSHRYIVDPDYLKHIKNSGKPFVVNVYGSDSAIISKKFWEFTENAQNREKFIKGNIPDYDLATPPITQYGAFGKSSYWDDVYIDSCQDAMAVLAIDLPYKYYSNQNLPGNIFTWDIGTEEYQIGGKSLREINRMIEEIATHGFTEPLYMRINEGCLTPVDNETAVKLFLATYMNLPTIPTVLFMSDDDAVKNRGYEELHEAVHSNIWHNQSALNLINDICKPYFFFETAEDCRKKGYLQVGQFLMAKSQHPTMQNIEDLNVEIFDRYLDTSAPHEEVQVPLTEEENMIKLQARTKQLMEDLTKRLDEEAEQHVQDILNGVYDQN